MSSANQQNSGALTLNQQYVKDLSFEVPGAPMIFMEPPVQPHVKVALDVQARRLVEGQPQFEVALHVRVETNETAGEGETGRQLFIAELLYAGVFTLAGLPPQQIEPVLLIECPRLLFPFARNIIADVTRDGGFPPVMLQPVDFLALWQNRQAQSGVAPRLS
jgi:preprotein translocase subunit SecB